MNDLVIKAIALPPTFPLFMVPANEHAFMRGLIGMSLHEALAQAAARGIQPTTKPLPQVRPSAHSFCVVVDHLMIPWCVLLGEHTRVLH